MPAITFRQLTSSDDPQFAPVCQYQYAWWGEEFHLDESAVCDYMCHSICADRVPYTYLMESGEELIGFYQVKSDDLFVRPDYGPWLANGFIVPAHRRQGHFRTMMRAVTDHARAHGLEQLYLHSRHEGLYEKFGWTLIEQSDGYKGDGVLRRIYRFELPKSVV